MMVHRMHLLRHRSSGGEVIMGRIFPYSKCDNRNGLNRLCNGDLELTSSYRIHCEGVEVYTCVKCGKKLEVT